MQITSTAENFFLTVKIFWIYGTLGGKIENKLLIEQDNLILFLTSLNIISRHIFVAKAFTILYGRFSWRICNQENF